jgi:hypothetical protein
MRTGMAGSRPPAWGRLTAAAATAICAGVATAPATVVSGGVETVAPAAVADDVPVTVDPLDEVEPLDDVELPDELDPPDEEETDVDVGLLA